jgi:hypothetical protein
MVKRGTARRLGLRPWRGNDTVLGEVSTPDGGRHRIVLVGSRYRATYLDDRGSAVRGPRVTIGAGMINVHRKALRIDPCIVY